MKPRTISIAMATFNGGAYLQQQLDSFVNQIHSPDELVVTDDGSTDDTLHILECFRDNAPFAVKLYCNEERLGFARNFERAIYLCSGDIVFLSDQDDVWFPEKIEKVVQEFERTASAYVVINDQLITDEALRSSGVTKLENIVSMGLHDSHFRTGCCTAVDRCWLSVALPFPENVNHDLWINGLSLLVGAREVLAEPLQYYRRHGGNASRWLASQPRRASGWDRISLQRFNTSADGWQKQKAIKSAYLSRLCERISLLEDLGLRNSAENAISKLQQELSALDKRAALVSVPRWRRGPGLLRFLLAGGYGHFESWKSAAKDLIR